MTKPHTELRRMALACLQGLLARDDAVDFSSEQYDFSEVVQKAIALAEELQDQLDELPESPAAILAQQQLEALQQYQRTDEALQQKSKPST